MKSNKISIIAATLLLVGLVVFGVGFAMTGFNLSKLSTEAEFIEKSFVSPSGVSGIVIEDSNIAVKIIASPDDKVHVTYFENDKEFYEISQSKSGTLVITKKNDRKWYDYIFNLRFQSVHLTVAVPGNFSGDLSVKSSNSPIDASDIKAANILLDSSNARITASNVSVSAKFKASTSNGAITLSKVTALGDIVCDSSSGGITLDQVEGNTIETDTSNQDVVLTSVVSNDRIAIKTSNASIAFNDIQFKTGLDCYTSNGVVKGSLLGKLSDYTITSKTSNRKNDLPENQSGGAKTLVIETSNAPIVIGFMG